MASYFEIREHVIPASHIREYAHGTANTQGEQLTLHVKQYIPTYNSDPQNGDLTIIAAHGVGFPKELYEPLWEELAEDCRIRGVRLRAIWISDAAWQGQSGIINREKLGDDPGWFDYSRDILQMINIFRMPRPLMGIAHSFGATALTNIALFHPRLFDSVVLLDPGIVRHGPGAAEGSLVQSTLSSKRRDSWPSREEAAEAFKKSSFYQSWDKRVFDRWVMHGLQQRHSDSPEVTLATTKHQEVFTFRRLSYKAVSKDGNTIINRDLVPDMDLTYGPIIPLYRPEPPSVFTRLPNLRPWVLWVFGGQSYMSMPQQRKERVDATGTGVGGSGGMRAGRVKSVVGESFGHLIPFESPSFCAHAAAGWAEDTVKRWQEDEREYQAWAQKPLFEKTTLSPEASKALEIPVRPKM